MYIHAHVQCTCTCTVYNVTLHVYTMLTFQGDVYNIKVKLL